ncbi:MAG: GNAT family N-acetyltransferase [Actinophytocola sp.]|uniref:GNAT family N-acetyltransferase n=1 Tax=Actinophytocola sp. TaxID=1872138 RepID=UPI00132218F4|nr:GNAT family N-acetyltransferase [Actinophytocola sp.]MPZ80614.1 GNAT family N-acetyltransferase [Actinophytocola sp.]
MLDELMRRGWPALSEVDVSGWVARISGGVTQRANSVAPLAAPPDVGTALSRVERLYGSHGLPAVFQLGPSVHPADLDSVLAARGYRYGSPTTVEVASVAQVLDLLPDGVPVAVAAEPDEEWMDLWWAVDGRGDDAARDVARWILTAGPALYGTVRSEGTVAAVARLATVDDWGGLYCMAVRPGARRRGLGSVVLRGLLAHAATEGVRHCWLQVRAESSGARALYARAGFAEAARYHYRTQPTP